MQSAYYLAGIKVSQHLCESVNPEPDLPSKSSTQLQEAAEALRDELESVFLEDNTTLTTDEVDAPTRKQPRLSSVFATSPPVNDNGILTPFFGVYNPGNQPPPIVRLQILDILSCDSNGFIDLHLSDGDWYAQVKVSATFKDYFL